MHVVRVTFLALGLAGATALSAAAQDSTGQTCLCYGPHLAYSVAAPSGWVLDNQAGNADGVSVVFYRRGDSWQTGLAVMYVNTVEADSGDTANVQLVVRDDSSKFVNEHPALRVASAPVLRTGDGRVAIVRHFINRPQNAYEAVAYIHERRVTPLIVLTARTRGAFDAALPAFAKLVASYTFFTDSVTVTK